MAYFKTKLEVTVNLGSNASEADMFDHNKEFITDLTKMIEEFYIGKNWYSELYTDYDKSKKVDISIDVKKTFEDHY